MFRQPRAEQFEYYRALQNLGLSKPTKFKKQAKVRKRRRTRDPFARERRAELVFKQGERRFGQSGRMVYQGVRSQDVDKRRNQYRPDRLLAIHQSSFNNANRDANEIKRGMSSVGTTLGNEKLAEEKVKVEKEKAQALRDFSNKVISNPQNLLGYKPHRSPEDINAQYRQDIESGVIGGQEALDFLEALQERQEMGYKEHRQPADLNRQSRRRRRQSSPEAQADIEELPITPRPTPAQEAEKKDKRKAFLATTDAVGAEPVFVEGQGSVEDVLDSPTLREAVSGLRENIAGAQQQEPLLQPAPEPQPEPEATTTTKPKSKKKPKKPKAPAVPTEPEPQPEPIPQPTPQAPQPEPQPEPQADEDAEYKLLLTYPTGSLTQGSDRRGWDESPFEFVDKTGVVGKKKKGKRYQIMNIGAKNYSIVDSDNENLAGWSSISKSRMDKLVKQSDIQFLDNTFG